MLRRQQLFSKNANKKTRVQHGTPKHVHYQKFCLLKLNIFEIIKKAITKMINIPFSHRPINGRHQCHSDAGLLLALFTNCSDAVIDPSVKN